MSVLVALVREAQPGRPAEVREALRAEAHASTQRHRGIRAYQLLQGRAQSNLYVDLIEWVDRASAERANAASDHPDGAQIARLLDTEHMTLLGAAEVAPRP